MSRRTDFGSLWPGTVVAFAGALVLHLLLGWPWTIAGAAAGGAVSGRKGWLVGGVGAVLAWGALVVWSYSVDAHAVGEMTRVMGVLLGDLPPASTVGLTLLIGMVLGGLGGAMGALARNIRRPGER